MRCTTRSTTRHDEKLNQMHDEMHDEEHDEMHDEEHQHDEEHHKMHDEEHDVMHDEEHDEMHDVEHQHNEFEGCKDSVSTTYVGTSNQYNTMHLTRTLRTQHPLPNELTIVADNGAATRTAQHTSESLFSDYVHHCFREGLT